MIPVIIGAALAAGAGIGYALGKDDKPEPVVVKKAEVSEDYVKWQLNRSGKNLQTSAPPSSSSMKFIPSGNFSADFEKIANFLGNTSVDNDFISNALDSIEERAFNQFNDQALNFVAYYREKLRNRR